MKSTSDHRDTPFEIVAIHQFGDGNGGLAIRCIERGTGSHADLRIATEDIGEELNGAIVDVFAKIEHLFEAQFTSRMPTPAQRHQLLRDAEDARAEVQARKDELAKLDAEIAARKAAPKV